MLYYPGGSNDSFFFGTDSTVSDRLPIIATGEPGCGIREIAPFSVDSGFHTFDVMQREPDAIVDMFILTTDPNFNPTTDSSWYYGPTPPVDSVTFQVDMSNHGSAFTTVYVSGSFNGWGGGDNPLTDQGNGIWSAKIGIPDAPDSIEYKFQLDQWAQQENFDPATEDSVCTLTTGGFTNRLSVITGDTILPVVCYDMCGACPPPVLDSINITFAVSASEINTDSAGLYLAGGSGFGLPGDNAMMDPDGNDVWWITLRRPEGFSSHYTFLNGNCPDWSCKENIGGQPCADPNNFNDRFLPATYNDTTIYTCFGECRDDTMCTATGGPANVTFRIDVRGMVVDTAGGGWTVAGGFEGWNRTVILTDMDGDSIYEATAQIQPSDIEYKFVNGNNWEEFDPATADSACTITTGTFTNRFAQISGDTVLCIVTFAECCRSVGIDKEVLVEDLFYVHPNPTSDFVRVSFQSNAQESKTVEVFNLTGAKVFESHVAGADSDIRVDVSSWSAGVYLVKVRMGNSFGFQKLVVD